MLFPEHNLPDDQITTTFQKQQIKLQEASRKLITTSKERQQHLQNKISCQPGIEGVISPGSVPQIPYLKNTGTLENKLLSDMSE